EPRAGGVVRDRGDSRTVRYRHLRSREARVERSRKAGVVGDVAERRELRLARAEQSAPETPALRDVYAFDRCSRRKGVPHCQTLEYEAASVRERERARIPRRRL